MSTAANQGGVPVSALGVERGCSMNPWIKRGRCVAAGLMLAGLCWSGVGWTQELRIGLQVDITAIDPHFSNVDANSAMAAHIFSRLVERDDKLKLRPGLATSWSLIDDRTWEFKLRRGVKFHDGGDFTAEDAKVSLERVPAVPNAPSSFAIYVRQIKAIEIVDPYTIRLKTDELFTAMPLYMSTIAIMSKKALSAAARPENKDSRLLATTEQLNAGQGAVGTGPFRLVEWQRGQHTILERFDDYFGDKPEWKRVTIRPITNNAARVAALLSGDVDLIDYVPITDIGTLTREPKLAVSDSVTVRIIFLALDRHREAPPFVVDSKGNPLGRNPFNDIRVRKAISKAIDRKAIVERVMDGQAVATGQIMPEGFYGHSPTIAVEPLDVAGARQLLAEAGYPNGFGVTIHSPRNRYPNDAQITQAIAQMLSRIGITAKVEAVPASVFFPRAQNLEFSFFLTGYGIVTGEPSSFLSFSIITHDAARGRGAGNRGRYSSAKVDALYDEALRTADPAKAESLLRQATEEAVADVGFIPLLHNLHVWAMRRDLAYPGRTDEYTLAHAIRTRK